MGRTQDSRSGLSLGVIAPNLSFAGGAERLALQCVARWQGRHRVTLYSEAFDDDLLEGFGISGDVPRVELPTSLTRVPTSGPAARVADALVLPRIWAAALGPHDVYLGHQWRTLRIERSPFVWYAHETDRHAYDLLRERDSEAVGSEMGALLHGFEPVGPDRRFAILQAAMRQVDTGVSPQRVVANSRFTARELERGLGLRDVEVVYPGVDPDGFLEPRFDEPFFLSVGNLLPHKRHRLAIEALSLVPGARLVIVGGGRSALQLDRMAVLLGVADRVEIRSDVTDDELRRLYAGCRAVVFTPVNEPFGMVALEALAAGKPLVAVDRGGFTEIVDGSCAMLLPPEPPAFATALQALLDRPEDARRMGEAGRKLARQWSWDRTAEGLEAVLLDAHRDALRRAGPGRRDAAAGSARPSAPERPHRSEGPARPPVGIRLILDYGEGVGEGNWRMPGAADEMPRAGYYASHHESTLRRQLAEIESCGFDFTLLSLYLDDRRLSPYGALALRHAFELAAEPGAAARFAVELELNRPTPQFLDRALDWASGVFREFGAAFELGGRPLVLLRNATAAQLAERPGLSLRATPEPGDRGDLRTVSVASAADLGDRLASALASPAPVAALVSSWNDYPRGEFIEPTVREGDARLASARAALERRAAG